MNTRVIVLAAVCAVVVLACNEVPVRNLTTSYQVQIQELRDRGKPAKLDVVGYRRLAVDVSGATGTGHQLQDLPGGVPTLYLH